MEIVSKTGGIQFKKTADRTHADVFVYGNYRGYVKDKHDQKWYFYRYGITNSAGAEIKVFDTQDELEKYLVEAEG